MQAAILAAGKSTRMYPLTLTRPKPLLRAANKTLLERNLDNLKGIADEVIIIVGYKKEMIKLFLKNKYKSLKIKYVEQKQQLGTGHAASLLEPYIRDRFILLMGDDIYSREDIKNCIKHRYSILTAKTKNQSNASERNERELARRSRKHLTRSQLSNFGAVIEKNGILINFVEKPKKFISDTINTAMYYLDKDIFNYLKKIRKSKRNEIELPDAIKLLAKEQNIYCVKTRQWLPIGYPLDLLKADAFLRKSKNFVGENSKIHGKIVNSSVGDNCIIKGSIKNSIIMDNTVIDEKSTVKDSIIASNAYFKGRASNEVIADNVRARKLHFINFKI
jgi:NDP-sugar pyrophosphorylase family protein